MAFFRRSAAALLACLVLTGGLRANAATGEFADVPENHWAAESIYWCARYGLLQGVGDNVFALGAPMTRAAYATALCRMMKWDMLTPARGSFADNQNPKAWYYSAVETAYAHGALTAQNRLCRPDDPITREEMAMMTVRALGYSLLAGAAAEDCRFTDVSVGAGYIALADRMGIVNGIDQFTFNPKATAKREEAAAMLLRAYDRWMTGITCLNWDETSGTAAAVPSLIGESGSVPVSPRASFEAIYSVVRSGADTLLLNLVPYAQSVTSRGVGEGRELTTAELDALLAAKDARVYHSDRHGSSYLLHREADGSTTVVWFVSAEDLHAKLTLCKMLGLEQVYLRRAAVS